MIRDDLQQTHIWTQHVSLVAGLNSFPHESDCCLFPVNTQTRWGAGLGSSSVSAEERLSKGMKKNNKATETAGLSPPARPTIETRNAPLHQREDAAITTSKYTSFHLWFVLQQSLHLLCLWPLLSLLRVKFSYKLQKKGVFCGPRCLTVVMGWCTMTDAVGRHDRGGEAISGTSEAPGTKALWHPVPLSNTLSATADLGLNHYQKKGAPLDRKMERQSACKWECVREREARGKRHE